LEVNFFKIKKSKYSLLTVVFLAILTIFPILSLFIGSMGINISNFLYLSEYLLLDYTISTVYLLSLTLVFSFIFGVIPAWLISTSRFRGRRIYDLLLYLPLAIPTYIMAFSYGDILSFSGPFQSFVRDFIPSLINFVNRDYLQIEILAILLAFSLYPYLYAACRISFSLIGNNYINLSRNLGLNEINTFLKVGLPLSRPAIFSAVFLISMEVLNEYGAVSYFGVNTYTSGIFRAWGSMADMDTASLLAIVLFLVVCLFFGLEKWLSSKFKYNFKSNSDLSPYFKNSNKKLIFTHISCIIIILAAFAIPILYMVNNIIIDIDNIDFFDVYKLSKNTILVSLTSSILIVIVVILIQYLKRISKSKILNFTGETISLTYALPGAVIGISLILLFSPINDYFGFLLIGSIPVLIYAYFIRYMAVAVSPIVSSFKKYPMKLDDSGKSLGLKPFEFFRKIFFPLNKSAIIIAFCICFVDIMKDLPLTLILRPFNFDTLATQTYEYAIEEMITKSSIYSITIVIFGVILLSILSVNQSKK
jgi:iron(III) transport system permease protein